MAKGNKLRFDECLVLGLELVVLSFEAHIPPRLFLSLFSFVMALSEQEKDTALASRRCSQLHRKVLLVKELPQSHSSQVWRRQSKTSAYGATTSSISRAGNNGGPLSMPGTWPSSAKTRRPRRIETQRGLGPKEKGRRGPGPARPKRKVEGLAKQKRERGRLNLAQREEEKARPGTKGRTVMFCHFQFNTFNFQMQKKTTTYK